MEEFLLSAQKKASDLAFDSFFQPRPDPDFSLIEELQLMDDLDVDSEDDNHHDSDSDSDSESEDNHSSDDDYMETDTASSDNSSESGRLMDVDMDSDTYSSHSPPAPAAHHNFVQEEIPSYPCAVPKESSAQRKRKQMEALLQSVKGLPVTWAQHMRDFFYPTTSAQAQSSRDEKLVVQDLVDMRLLPSHVYTSKPFTDALEASLRSSGLADMMYKICRPGNLLETTHPDVERSFRFHNWKLSYAEIYVRWIPESITQAQYRETLPPVDPDYKIDVDMLLRFISDHPRMHPWSYNPMACFLFLSASCFEVNCDLWLVPSLATLQFKLSDGWLELS
ncbi:hypothetical protein GGX14DRAFT_402712 [Mycena pura]|uniref:Uncharacterized protein n=1 Tax=Mycena pura TaxID=153505 RepID=A0AAD6V1D3_9AGAR|nr:hypothetical protein GGX14DRAFT_402712 [Mycena pura]